jgi:hypothetical protein
VINRKTADALAVAIPSQLYIFADDNELAEAREHLAEALEQQTATSESSVSATERVVWDFTIAPRS